jgi:hypothetical protein
MTRTNLNARHGTKTQKKERKQVKQQILLSLQLQLVSLQLQQMPPHVKDQNWCALIVKRKATLKTDVSRK